ncbi:alpha/beta hydrolase [Spongiimicrobium salis]|uniref:alpha/beta hydrolase n=1 Tax=Spongiimicrobium salis TaxID=1667022 RepID=UPI00374CB255
MKRTILIALSAIILTLLTVFVIIEVQAQKAQLRGDFIEELHSEILDESRKLLIHLPKGYGQNTNKRYPILVALDGTSHDHIVANAVHTLNYAQTLSDIIIVGIPNTDRKRDLTPEYMHRDKASEAMGEGDRFLEFLEKEAIPFIEKKYRGNGYRMLSGHSRGGLFTMYALMEKPILFKAYFCHSPAFWREDNRIVKKMNDRLKKSNSLKGFIYLSLGSQENEKMKKGFNKMVALLEKNRPKELKVSSEYTEGGTHQTNPYYAVPHAFMLWQEQTKQILK